MTRIVLAPCSPFSVTPDLMRESAKLARSHKNVYLHTHLAETLDEERYTQKQFDVRTLLSIVAIFLSVVSTLVAIALFIWRQHP